MRQEKVRFQTDKQFLIVLTNILNFVSSRVLKPPGGGSSDIFGTSSADNDNKPINPKKYNSHFSIGDDLAEEVTRKASSIDSNDGASTPSQTSTSNGSPNNSEPNTPRSGKNTKLVRLPHYQNFLAFSPPSTSKSKLKTSSVVILIQLTGFGTLILSRIQKKQQKNCFIVYEKKYAVP